MMPSTSVVRVALSEFSPYNRFLEDHPDCARPDRAGLPSKPFNPSTTIRYGLPHRAAVEPAVYNSLGRLVALLQKGEQETGYHEVRFDKSGLSSGVYFYRIHAGVVFQTRKLALVR